MRHCMSLTATGVDMSLDMRPHIHDPALVNSVTNVIRTRHRRLTQLIRTGSKSPLLDYNAFQQKGANGRRIVRRRTNERASFWLPWSGLEQDRAATMAVGKEAGGQCRHTHAPALHACAAVNGPEGD